MPPITTIVHFEVPAKNVDRFFAYWQDYIKQDVSERPGLIDGILHRGTDADAPFQFINVARWDSAEHLASALEATGESLPIASVFRDLGVTISQNNYVDAVRYAASRG